MDRPGAFSMYPSDPEIFLPQKSSSSCVRYPLNALVFRDRLLWRSGNVAWPQRHRVISDGAVLRFLFQRPKFAFGEETVHRTDQTIDVLMEIAPVINFRRIQKAQLLETFG